ncbi:MAG: adenylyltransferase/cytidyltransferase family protein [Ignavibacteriales bacterium]
MKSSKYSNIYVIGVFDLFHVGHIELLKKAKQLGEKLIVAVNSDDLVSVYKRKPYYNEENRLALVKACRYVDDAFIIGEFDNKPYIEKYDIDAIVHGNDWEYTSYLEQIRVSPEYLKERNVELVLLPYTEGISTSHLIKTIKEN